MTYEWSNRFEHGFSQIVDWYQRMDEYSGDRAGDFTSAGVGLHDREGAQGHAAGGAADRRGVVDLREMKGRGRFRAWGTVSTAE